MTCPILPWFHEIRDQGSHNIRFGLVGLPMMCFQMPSFLGETVPFRGPVYDKKQPCIYIYLMFPDCQLFYFFLGGYYRLAGARARSIGILQFDGVGN